MSEMTFAERMKYLTGFFTSGAANALHSGYREAIGSAYQLASELVEAGLGKRQFYEKKRAWLMAAAIGELEIPQVALKGKFRGWQVANGQIYTVDELYGVRKLFRNGEQVYEGDLLKWFLDEEGHWYVERDFQGNPKRGGQILCDGKVVFEGFYDKPRASEGHLYIPLDGETSREGVEFLFIYKDGDRNKLVYQGRVDRWCASRGSVFVINKEGDKTSVHVDGKNTWEEDECPYPLKVRNGWVFKLEPKFPAGSWDRCHGQFTFTPECFHSVIEKDMDIVDWYPYFTDERGSLCVFVELKDKKTGSHEIWRWPGHYHQVWTVPFADYRVDGTDLYVRIFQADGTSVILKLENP